MSKPLPSIKALTAVFGHDNAKEARRVLEISRDELLTHYKEARDFVDACHGFVPAWELRMLVLDRLANTSGVEYIDDRHGGVHASYLNAGDAYATTLVRYATGTYRVTTWADVAEAMERRHGPY